MAHTHEFDCKICGAHIDSREELDRHNRANHPESIQAGQPNRGSDIGTQSSPPNQSGQQRS
jgi:hypothetical protein